MFRIGLSILLSVLLLQDVLSQSNLTKEKTEVWNSVNEKWDLFELIAWTYDADGRQVAYDERSHYQEDHVFQNQRVIRSTFFSNGNLATKETRQKDQWNNIDDLTEYIYDSQKRLKEERRTVKDTHTQEFRKTSRKTYDYQNDGRKMTIAESRWLPDQEAYVLDKQSDIIRDENNCIIEYTIVNYFNSTRGEQYIYIRDQECRILSSEWLRKANSNSSFSPHLKQKIEHLDEGKKIIIIYEKYETPGNWEVYGQREIHYNDKGLEIRNHYIDLEAMPPSDLLITNRMDEEGRNLAKHTYKDNVLTNLETSVFEFNEQNWIISHKRTQQDYVLGLTETNKNFYTHYCDGQVKTQRYDDLPQSFRVSYEYTTGEDCLLGNEEPSILVFPNPARRKIDIKTNLLLGDAAIVNIFAPDGREVYDQQVNSYTDQIEIDVSIFTPGNYYLFIQNGKVSVSKRILIVD